MRLRGYLLKDRIGRGGYGKVFAARVATVGNDGVDGSTADLDVALKKARVTNHVRHPLLLHEAWALIQLRGHPNIPRAFGWGRSQYFQYLVMELLGPDLQDTVKNNGLTQRNAVALICQMLDVLEYVHGEGLVHCDIKPSNFVFGRVYLIDFGLALQRSPDFKRGGPRGTVPYCSLRVLGGEAPLPRDDLESLAYTVVRLATGTLPWARWSPRQRLDGSAAVSGRDLMRGLPDVFARFVDFARGLAPTDDLQYQRWREAFRGLEPSLPEHPMFDHGDGGRRLWMRWVTPSRGDGPLHDHGESSADYILADSKHVLGGSESRSEEGGEHGFCSLMGSEWYFPVAISPRYVVENEFDVVSRHLELIDEPPLYDGGRSVDDMCPPEVMNNTQSNLHCIRP